MWQMCIPSRFPVEYGLHRLVYTKRCKQEALKENAFVISRKQVLFLMILLALRRRRVTSTGCVSKRATPIPAAPASSVTPRPPNSPGP